MKIYKRCKTPEDGVATFIVKDGKQLGLCGACWKKVGEGDYEWGLDPKPIAEEILGRRAKEEAAATLTEYSPHLKGSKKYQEKSLAQLEDEEIESVTIESEKTEEKDNG